MVILVFFNSNDAKKTYKKGSLMGTHKGSRVEWGRGRELYDSRAGFEKHPVAILKCRFANIVAALESLATSQQLDSLIVV